MRYLLKGTFSSYGFDNLREALERLSKWSDKEMITEREAANFIMQLFHQIPDELYNSIQNEE